MRPFQYICQPASISSPQASDYLADPLTNVVTTFSDARSLLFASGVELCGQSQSLVKVPLVSVPDAQNPRFDIRGSLEMKQHDEKQWKQAV